MANPQKENGYVPIANEIMEALAGIRISGEARQCLDVIFRKTYGFNKKEDIIPLSQFCFLTKMSKPRICHALKKLENMNLVIAKKGNSIGTFYRFNKDFDTWKSLPKKATLPKKEMVIAKKGNKSLPIIGHSKDSISKDTITKDISSAPTSGADETTKDIPLVFEIFQKSINPTINYGHKTQRKAAEELLKKFGRDKTLAIAQYAVSIQGEKFAPVITHPYQLKEKIGELFAFKKRRDNEMPSVVKIR